MMNPSTMEKLLIMKEIQRAKEEAAHKAFQEGLGARLIEENKLRAVAALADIQRLLDSRNARARVGKVIKL